MNRRSSTQQAVRLAVVAALLVIVGFAVSYEYNETLITHAQGPNGRVSHTVSGNTETWRIDEPNVKQHVTPYPQIRFQRGDHITIDAGGCVQTGGHGSTWKRYVNPSGPNADRLYHGLIWIPGAIGGRAATGVPPDPKRIVFYIRPRLVTVPSGVDTRELYLRLGYEDDQYDDNGYYAHDDGTENQCKGVGNAYVVITIAHGFIPPPPSAAAPFDLVWDSEDDNGIPLNPKWGWQITHPGTFPDPMQCTNGPHKSPCTTWQDAIKLDTADICSYEQYDPTANNEPPRFGVPGHANWAAGTFVGRITWLTHSCPCDSWCAISTGACDDDYNFAFYPSGGAGLTAARDNIESEFDSDETIDHFNTPWWDKFHNAVDNYKTDDEVNQLWFKEPDGTMGRYAIVTGLIGLEFAHTVSTELHPVWAMAVRVKDDDPADEVWAMFVRRWGNEGFCSGDQHYLEGLANDTYTFRLPWRPGASSVGVGSATTFQANYTATVTPQVAPNQGVLVSISVPLGGEDRLNGELHLQWTGGQGPAPIPPTAWLAPPTVTEAQCENNCTATGSDCWELKTGNQTIYQRCIAQCKQKCQAQGPARVRRLPGRLPVGTIQAPEPEKRLASLVAKMTPAQRAELSKLTPRPPVSHDTQTVRLGAVNRIQSLPRRTARARRVQFRSVPDPKKRARNQRLLDFVRRTSGSRRATQ